MIRISASYSNDGMGCNIACVPTRVKGGFVPQIANFRNLNAGTEGESCTNKASFAVHKLSTTHRDADVPYRRDGYWLGKRRDGRSDVWMIASYNPKNRQVVYRTTKTRILEEAKAVLDEYAFLYPLAEGYRVIAPIPSRHVYFIGGDVGGIKIGIASDPEQRLKALQCGSPIPLRIFAVCEGGRSKEREYHARFASYRTHGEWFCPHPDILAEIDRIKAGAA